MLTSLHAWRKPLPLPPLKQKNFQAYENNNDDSEHGVAHDAQPALQAENASVLLMGSFRVIYLLNRSNAAASSR